MEEREEGKKRGQKKNRKSEEIKKPDSIIPMVTE